MKSTFYCDNNFTFTRLSFIWYGFVYCITKVNRIHLIYLESIFGMQCISYGSEVANCGGSKDTTELAASMLCVSIMPTKKKLSVKLFALGANKFTDFLCSSSCIHIANSIFFCSGQSQEQKSTAVILRGIF